MPRRKRKRQSKMGAVREVLQANPDATPAEIVAALKDKGLEMTPAHASNYKSQLKSAAKKAARIGKRIGAAARQGQSSANGIYRSRNSDPPLVQHAKALVEQLGKEWAKKMIDAV
jgi:lambda repressor-like predicted transcriptional regulator